MPPSSKFPVYKLTRDERKTLCRLVIPARFSATGKRQAVYCPTAAKPGQAILRPASDGAQGGCNGGLRPTGSQRESALCIKRGSGYSPPGGLAKREAFAPKGAMIGRHMLALIHPAIRQGSVSNKSTWISHGFTPVALIQGSTPRTWGASLHQDHGENVGVSPRAHPITVPPPNGGIAPV